MASNEGLSISKYALHFLELLEGEGKVVAEKVANAEKQVKVLISAKLSQPLYDSLVCRFYDAGYEDCAALVNAVNRGKEDAIRAAWLAGSATADVAKRRAAELQMWAAYAAKAGVASVVATAASKRFGWIGDLGGRFWITTAVYLVAILFVVGVAVAYARHYKAEVTQCFVDGKEAHQVADLELSAAAIREKALQDELNALKKPKPITQTPKQSRKPKPQPGLFGGLFSGN